MRQCADLQKISHLYLYLYFKNLNVSDLSCEGFMQNCEFYSVTLVSPETFVLLKDNISDTQF
jgi:hypothetical protein